MACSIARSLDVIGDWWSPLIIRDVYLGVNRFDDLVNNLTISRNLLTARLKTLIDGGILHKHLYHQHPPRYEYQLTEAGRDFVPILFAVMAWGDKWLSEPEGPPMILRDAETGDAVAPAIYDRQTGKPIELDSITPTPGPGGRATTGTRIIVQRFSQQAGAKAAS